MPPKLKPGKSPAKPLVNFAPLLSRPHAAREATHAEGFVRVELLGSPTDESFSMQDIDGWQYHWNVTRARTLAEQSGHLFRFRPADFGLSLARVTEQYPDMDAEYALTTDLSRPLLLTLFERQRAGDDEPNTLQLLDGWHRLYKALLTGVAYLPAYLLTQKQSEQVLFATLPPGSGIDWGQERKGEPYAGQTF